VFHELGDADRRLYVDGLAAVLWTGGRDLMLCFSDRQPAGWGHAG
jgi:hypothetical protein